MCEKLVPDAKCDQTDPNHYLLTSAETITIQPGQVQIVHTGFRFRAPLLLSLAKGLDHLDMCVLLTTAVVDGRDCQVAILNRGTDPVTLNAGETLLHVVAVPLDQTEY